ncbi:CRISPR-associated protein Cas5 [Nocardia lijiangensis]|uniref:CRISPR-associated protein Cas5 n=1 Tax=Nocardia lijiangensis TaxID=299618 RepID=UPI00082D5832|nr:CRISPR-associated protein Cas5 [Nocardia lijiangensis]
MTDALQVTVTAAVASFRNPLYAGVQVGLPCPPPSTIAGMLAAAAGGWDRVPIGLRFGAAFTAAGAGTDLETYHPLDGRGRATAATPKDREFLADVVLTVWLVDDLDFWGDALRRPVWPLRLGRSQDLAAARTERVELVAAAGRQGHAIVPASMSVAGTLLRLPTVLSVDRARNRWDGYRYARSGSDQRIDTGCSVAPTEPGVVGQAVALLGEVHPGQFDSGHGR